MDGYPIGSFKSFEKSSAEAFSPLHSEESTLKRLEESQYFKGILSKEIAIPTLNLANLERPNFHEEFMELNESNF